MTHSTMHLTSAEIASLWTEYMNDSMTCRVLGFMLKDLEDPEIKSIVQYAFDIATEHLAQLEIIFQQEQYAKPNGFTEQDVNMEAPRLYTDTFCLTYVNEMARVGMISTSGYLSMSARADVREHFSKGLTETITLYNKSTEIAVSKGVFARPPYIEVPQETDFVNDKSYFSGLNPFSEKRPLNAVEISYLFMNTVTNSMGVKLCISFSQTSPSKVVQDFMLRGKDISKKHIKIFSNLLLEDDIQTPELPDLGVSNSTTKTFSDKLLMFHMSLLSAAGIGNYATAAAASQRTDLVTGYERLSLEVAKLAKSGADIMIKNAWLEQPPETKDKTKLAENKGSEE